jgi:hypothetical protein
MRVHVCSSLVGTNFREPIRREAEQVARDTPKMEWPLLEAVAEQLERGWPLAAT